MTKVWEGSWEEEHEHHLKIQWMTREISSRLISNAISIIDSRINLKFEFSPLQFSYFPFFPLSMIANMSLKCCCCWEKSQTMQFATDGILNFFSTFESFWELKKWLLN